MPRGTAARSAKSRLLPSNHELQADKICIRRNKREKAGANWKAMRQSFDRRRQNLSPPSEIQFVRTKPSSRRQKICTHERNSAPVNNIQQQPNRTNSNRIK